MLRIKFLRMFLKKIFGLCKRIPHFSSQSELRLPLLQVVSSNKYFSVGVQSPTEINAPRGCAVILKRRCQLALTRITHQVSRAFDLNMQAKTPRLMKNMGFSIFVTTFFFQVTCSLTPHSTQVLCFLLVLHFCFSRNIFSHTS